MGSLLALACPCLDETVVSRNRSVDTFLLKNVIFLHFLTNTFNECTYLDKLNMMNLYLVKFEARWILNERAFCCFIIFFIWKWILT